MLKFKVVRKDVPAPLRIGIEVNPGPRGPGVELTEYERYRVIFLKHENNLSIREISKKMQISTRTVKDIISKFRETESVQNFPRSGRKRKLTPSEETKLVKLAKKGKVPIKLKPNFQNRPKLTLANAQFVECSIAIIWRILALKKYQKLPKSTVGKDFIMPKIWRIRIGKGLYLQMKSRFGWKQPRRTPGRNRINEKQCIRPVDKKTAMLGRNRLLSQV